MSHITPGSEPSPASPSPAAGTNAPPLRHVTVSGIHWQNVLDFTQLFRGFRMAINPAKLLIALAAILLIYTAGRTFDFAWGPQVYKGEIESFQSERADRYRMLREEQISARSPELESMLQVAAAADNSLSLEQIEALKNSPREAYRALKKMYEARFRSDVADAREQRVKTEADIKTNGAPMDGVSPAEAEQEQRAAVAKMLYDRMQRAKEAVGQGIFDAFLSYEIRQFDALVDNTLSIVRVGPVHGDALVEGQIEGAGVSAALVSKDPSRFWQPDTVVGCIANMAITGPRWLFCGTAPMQWHSSQGAADVAPAPETWTGWMKMILYRGTYLCSLALFAAFCLIVLALAGAILARLSALEMGGIERVPLKDAVVFSLRRWWVFIKAPITPLLILLAIGVLLALAGVIGAIPFIGEILLGVFFIVFLAVGFVLMLLLLGILGGFNFLYPTIAVEGADAFDAMSRSFAYVYARPWRLLLYSVVALIYGILTFLFVSFAIYLILLLTHTFAGWGTSLLGYNHGWFSGSPELDTLWPAPVFGHLLAGTNWYAMNWSEFIGSLFLHFWVYLLASVSGAYIVSYYFSTHTIIYLLLRRSVDGQTTLEIFSDEDAGATVQTAAPATPAAMP